MIFRSDLINPLYQSLIIYMDIYPLVQKDFETLPVELEKRAAHGNYGGRKNHSLILTKARIHFSLASHFFVHSV